jgi:hypothetical protein
MGWLVLLFCTPQAHCLLATTHSKLPWTNSDTLTYIAVEWTWTYSKHVSRDCYPAHLLARQSDLQKTQIPLLLHDGLCLQSCCLTMRWSNLLQYIFQINYLGPSIPYICSFTALNKRSRSFSMCMSHYWYFNKISFMNSDYLHIWLKQTKSAWQLLVHNTNTKFHADLLNFADVTYRQAWPLMKCSFCTRNCHKLSLVEWLLTIKKYKIITPWLG